MSLHDKSFLTALSPIEYRVDDPDGRLVGLRETLTSHDPQHSPFANCPMAHMVRLQIIEHIRPHMGDTSGQHLHTPYLLFVAELDGGNVWDFLDCLYEREPDFVQAVWGRCLGFPEHRGAVFFRRYIRRCEIVHPMPYAAFDDSVIEILTALKRQRHFVRWACDAAELPASELQKSWRAIRESLQNPEPPNPGKQHR